MYVNKSKIVIVGLILLLSLINRDYFAQNEDIYFDHLTVENGLSNSLVFEMTQDSLGFIWIATQDGLNRYDGYNFKVFRTDDSIKTVSDNWIACVTTDNKGNVWYGTRTAGFEMIDFETGKFISFKDRLSSEFGIEALNIQNLFITHDQKILIATWGAGLLIYDQVKSEFKQYLNEINKNSISENRVYSVFEDSKGNIWAGTQRRGLNKLDVKTGKFEHYNLVNSDPNTISNNFILTIAEDFQGDIWAGTYSNGLYKIVQGTDKIIKYDKKFGMTGVRIAKVFEDSKKNLWICTNGNGIFKFLRSESRFINFRNDPLNSKSLNRDKVWSVFEDKSGLLWFGTLTNGINIYDYSKNEFHRITTISNKKNSIISNYIKGIYRDPDNKIWIATPDGVSIISPNGKIKNLTEESGLSVNNSRVIYRRKNGEMWIGTWGGGINIYDPKTSKYKYLINEADNPNSLADNYLKCILEYGGKIYIGTERGFNEYDPVTKTFKKFIPIQGDSTTISNYQVTCLYLDKNENFWVGTNGGLNLFDTSTGKFERIRIENENRIPSMDRIRDVLEDSKGNIWVGTLGAGLAKYDRAENKYTYITTKEGLSNNSIYEILEDDTGSLWISTNVGLNRYNPETGAVSIYRASDGLPNDEFNHGAAMKAPDGTLYFGGVEGLTYFDPALLSVKSQMPRIVITKITINGKLFNKQGFYHLIDKIQLPYERNFINISFAAMDFSDSKSNKYRYMLEGLNNNWVSNENGNTAVFTDLDPGRYVFNVQGKNRYGVWNKEGRKLEILIVPPWWETNLARAIFLVSAILLVYLFFRFRTNQIRQRQELLEKLVNERTKDLQKSKQLLENAVSTKDKLFSIIAHDLKNPFVALLGYSDLLTNSGESLSAKEKEESAKYIYNSSRTVYSLLENLLDWAQLQMNRLEYNPTNLNLQTIVNEVFGIYSISASLKSISLESYIDNQLFVNADENMVKAIFRNVISNAIKFTHSGGNIKVYSKRETDKINITIEDNGIGMDEETLLKLKTDPGSQISKEGTSNEKGTGLGLMLAKEFIILNKGEFNIFSSQGKGTKISFCLMAAE